MIAVKGRVMFVAYMAALIVGLVVIAVSVARTSTSATPDPRQGVIQSVPSPEPIDMVTSQPLTWISSYWRSDQKPSSGHFPFVFEVAAADKGDPGYTVGLYAGARTGRSGSHTYAFNAVVERGPSDPNSIVFGTEINTNNYHSHDDRNAFPGMVGLAIVQGGPYMPRAAILIGSASGVPYRNGLDIFDGGVSDYVIRYGEKFQVHTNGTVWVSNPAGGMERLVPESFLLKLEERIRRLELIVGRSDANSVRRPGQK